MAWSLPTAVSASTGPLSLSLLLQDSFSMVSFGTGDGSAVFARNIEMVEALGDEEGIGIVDGVSCLLDSSLHSTTCLG